MWKKNFSAPAPTHRFATKLYLISLDRKKFSAMVFDVASSDLVNMGMTVISYTIKDIKDEQGYLRALGMARTAQVRMPASVDQFND